MADDGGTCIEITIVIIYWIVIWRFGFLKNSKFVRISHIFCKNWKHKGDNKAAVAEKGTTDSIRTIQTVRCIRLSGNPNGIVNCKWVVRTIQIRTLSIWRFRYQIMVSRGTGVWFWIRRIRPWTGQDLKDGHIDLRPKLLQFDRLKLKKLYL